MSKIAIPDVQNDLGSHLREDEMIDAALVREALRRVVSSRHFQTSRRGKEFLQYVVNQKNNGHGDLLKERLIGVQIFGRKPDYSTGEDPVVRVQAGDVRRRLERYYADPDIQTDIVIDIPLGSYVPVFAKRNGEVSKIPGRRDPSTAPSSLLEHGLGPELDHETPSGLPPLIVGENTSDSSAPTHSSAEAIPVPHPQPEAKSKPDRAVWSSVTRYRVLGLLVVLTLIACLAGWFYHMQSQPPLRAFWLPASSSAKPVLLCLPKPMVYRPSDQLFDRYSKAHPDAQLTREARQDQILPLGSEDTIKWGDMIPIRTSGPGIGGVAAAINISKLLTEQGIRFELRFGEEATYTEMRDSPVVIIGAINTDWATQLTSESAFAFGETIEAPNIHETGGAKRVWKMERSGTHTSRDYGLITRQLSGKAGHFLVQVAGVSHFGTEAASEMLMEQQELANVLRAKGISLREKNLQIVVSTDVTNERSGPPHVVAVSSW